MKIKTVNVIEYVDDSIIGLTSFNDDQEGNQEAEAHYKIIVKEHDPEVTDEEMEVFLEDGYYESGEYQAFISHSS